MVARSMIPFILLFALYVQFHGDFGPGGGFQAGVIFGAGLILYGLIFGLETVERIVPPRLVQALTAVGVLIYGGVGLVAMVLGGNFLDYDTLGAHHGQHWGIFLVELGVGITVAAAITTFYYLFAGHVRREDS